MVQPSFKKKTISPAMSALGRKTDEEMIDAAFNVLFEKAFSVKLRLSTQTAVVRLTEAKFWLLHAFNDEKMGKEEQNAVDFKKNKDE